MKHFDIPVHEFHWMELKFPHAEMQTRPITITTTEGATFTATIWLDVPEPPNGKHSVCVVIPHIRTDSPAKLENLKARLHPSIVNRISRTPLEGGGFHYHLNGSQMEMWGTLIQPQLTDSDGKTAHL